MRSLARPLLRLRCSAGRFFSLYQRPVVINACRMQYAQVVAVSVAKNTSDLSPLQVQPRTAPLASVQTGARMASMHASSKDAAEDGIKVALITAPPSKAKEVARSIVEAKLAACVNIVPGITSVYHWKGAVEEDSESLLIAKTRSSLADRLIAHVREVHPYDVPEVIFTDVRGGLHEYLDWVRTSTLDPQAAPHGVDADAIGSGEKRDGTSGGEES